MSPRTSARRLTGLLLAGGLTAGLALTACGHRSGGSPSDPAASGTPAVTDPATLTFQRLADPPRTVVKDGAGALVAAFTDGARTVRLTGPRRTFAEPAFTKATVATDAWIRLTPTPWAEGAQTAAWFAPWLTTALADRSPDVFGAATQYLKDAPDLVDGKGVRYAGDAEFGPVSATDPDGRAENSDFQDYLGISWTFPDKGTVKPKASRYGDVDCSGFLRLIYGYRMGYPLLGGNDPGPGLPRRAYAISSVGPGVEVIPDQRRPVRDYDRLQPGDLVFFDTDPTTDGENDHSGIYLGLDDAGHLRFISSRTRANGPTFGDNGYTAILDGGAHFSATFRNARRI